MFGRGGRGRRAIVAALASLASALIVLAVAGRAAHELGAVAGRAVADVGAELSGAPVDGDGDGPSVDDLVRLGGASPVDVPRSFVERVAVAATRPSPRHEARRPVHPAVDEAPVLGILVRASVVRAAIRRGGRPHGAPIAPEGERPAGLVLSGVSSYGTALRDGDVLTRVGGTVATSEGRVVAAVAGAVRSGARAIDGEVWRAGRRIPFVVEIPRRKKKQP